MNNELYRDFIDRKLDQLDGHLIDIYNAIGGGGPSPITPMFSETLIADNPTMSNTINFSTSWTNYDLIKLVVAMSSDLTDQEIYYVPSNVLQAVMDLNAKLRIYHGSGYFNGDVTNNSISHTTTSNFEIYQVYAVEATNCNMVVDELYTSPTSTVPTEFIFNTTEDLFDYDLIFTSVNPVSSAVAFISQNFISPYKSNVVQFSNRINYRIRYGNTNYYYGMDEHSINEQRHFTITGIKFTGGNT